jgi:hypothetical protein
MQITRKAIHFIVIFFALASGAVAQLTCVASASVPFDMRAEGATEQAGDVVVVCTGGSPTPAGSPVPQVNITVATNANITSRLINGSTINTEALLLIDDPLPAAQTYCGTQETGCIMIGTGYGGGLGDVGFGNTGSPVSTSPAATNSYSPLAAPIGPGRFNAYGGVLVGANVVAFFGVPIDEPGPTGGQLTLRITNVRMNVSSLGAPADNFSSVVAFEVVSSSAGFNINNPVQTVGVVRAGLTARSVTTAGTLSPCASTGAPFPILETVNFGEGFSTATKLRVPVGGASQLSLPGNFFNTESQFVLGGIPPSTNFGQADSGTRFKIAIGNLQPGIQIFVPTTVGSAQLNGVSTETLRLTATETGPFSAVAPSTAAGVPSGYAPLAVNNGSAVAIYEVTAQQANSTFTLESFSVPVAVSYTTSPGITPTPGLTTVNVDFAPSSGSTVTASATGAIPRFVPPSTALTGFAMTACAAPSGPPTVTIEQATATNGNFTVSGWALDNTVSGTAIHSAGIAIDGVFAGSATYGASRPDICGLYPGRPGCPNVGFTYSGPLGPGAHTITVNATDSSIPALTGSASVAVTVPGVAAAVSVAPSAGSGSSQIFTAVYSDTAGTALLSRGWFLINSSLNSSGACFVQVNPTGMYLINDTSSALLGPLALGGSLSNSQCTLNSTGSGVVNSGNISTVSLSITFQRAFAGAKNIYMAADDTSGNSTGFQMRGTFTVVATVAPPGLYFVPITPCRVLDTRNGTGPFGGPSIAGQTSRSFVIPGGACNIPSNAQAYSMNVAVVPQAGLGFLTVWPTGESQPRVATLNSDGRVKSNAAIIPAGTGGAVSVFATNTTDVIFDINGYFLPANNAPAGLQFYPVTPCRLWDTRNPLLGPHLHGQTTRVFPFFPVIAGSCNIPAGAQAYSLNFAAVPLTGTLSYLTAWPTGQAQPFVATLNAPTGTVTANAAIVPAGTNGSISVFATDDTDLVIDINGYFAAPGSFGALSLYTVPPCRVLDTRLPAGSQPFSGTISVNVSASGCGAPVASRAFVLNATVVPPSGLGFLTLWPQATAQPVVATLNASDAAVTGNMAIVPDAGGSIRAFASNSTQLILDLFGYFAP